ncbi:MAG TPA: hypothetical protein ENJ79_07770 [Gammaproteobacteria bacterium]|nr:hypothetical protein [Gammaproteobacteria bacterium]
MNDNDLEALSEQLSAAEDRIIDLEATAEKLESALFQVIDLIKHLDPFKAGCIRYDLGALDKEGAA